MDGGQVAVAMEPALVPDGAPLQPDPPPAQDAHAPLPRRPADCERHVFSFRVSGMTGAEGAALEEALDCG